MKPHKRLLEALKQIAVNRPLYERKGFDAWLARRPGNVRRAPAGEQQLQYKAAVERAADVKSRSDHVPGVMA